MQPIKPTASLICMDPAVLAIPTFGIYRRNTRQYGRACMEIPNIWVTGILGMILSSLTRLIMQVIPMVGIAGSRDGR